jgi:WYL_2, Sm-like SH3 beta-barrel fold
MKNLIKINRSEVMRLAHSFKATGKTWSESLRQAWAMCKATALKETLKQGVVSFSFVKQDGTIRRAVGTMNETLFTYVYKTDRHIQKELSYTGTVVFWDLESSDWRCCRVDRIKAVWSVVTEGVSVNNIFESYKIAA